MKTEIQEAMHGGAHQVSHHGLSFLDLVSADIATLYHAMNDDGQQQTLALGLLRLFLRWVELHGNHVTRLHYCPPLGLLWGFRHGDDSAASLVHQSYSQAVWRERGLLERLQLLAILLLAWPPLNLAMIGWATGINGASIRARTGKSIRRQLSEQLTLAGRHSIMPLYYYMFDLYDPEKYRQAGHYLQRLETKGGVFRILKDHLQTESPMQDKVAFAERCRAHGVRTAPVILEFGPDGVKGGDGSEGLERNGASLPPIDLFAKTVRGRGGQGAERWDYDAGRRGWVREGTLLDEVGLLNHFATLARKECYLVQPRLVNHPELQRVANGALSTVRLLTCMNERGEPEATNAVFRMAIGRNSLVDNFHAGGIAAAIDMATGTLGRATDLGMRADRGWCDCHPDSGALIAGRHLPHWPHALGLVQRAHAAFPDRPFIGWDVAMLADGPCIVEGNGSPDLDIHQRCEGRPIGSARFGELLAFHLRQLRKAD
jgi:putative polysaccharide biosynthesis protein